LSNPVEGVLLEPNGSAPLRHATVQWCGPLEGSQGSRPMFGSRQD
jgi:hypothetical protein